MRIEVLYVWETVAPGCLCALETRVHLSISVLDRSRAGLARLAVSNSSRITVLRY